MNKPTPKKGILKSPPYVAGSHEIEGFTGEVAVLSANENPLGFPDDVKNVISNIEYSRYPDGSYDDLRNALGNLHNINPNNIICGNGSDEVLGLLIHSYAGAGDEVLITQHGFLMYKVYTLTANATPVVVDESDYTVNVDNILAGVTDKTKIIALANPANPTGTILTESEIVRLIENTRQDIIIILDCAYAEYCNENEYGNPAKLVEKYDNVVMTRTFSKAYGMASFRLGWCYAPNDVADVLNRARSPFNVSKLSQVAGIKAIADTDFIKNSVKHNDEWLEKLTTSFTQKGCIVPKSFGNFILVDFGNEDKANQFYDLLLENGIIARKVVPYDLPSCVRITIGTADENNRVIDCIEKMEF